MTAPRPSTATRLRRSLVRAVRAFSTNPSGGAWLLLVATVAALVWANSSPGGYASFWGTGIGVEIGDFVIELDVKHWVNDGLMVFFFFVLGLEVKREFTIGELTDWRRASVPLTAAAVGLVVPALIFVAFNPTGPAAGAWGVVISTDTAFLLGVLALVGPSCPGPLRVFLLTLAVADDVGALIVIAIFYTQDLAVIPLALSVAGMAIMVVLRLYDVRRGPPYFVLAVLVWVAMYESGVHPTIAGVVIALFSSANAPQREDVAEATRATTAFAQSPNAAHARRARWNLDRSVSGADRMQLLYQPWANYLIVPLFALANAGVALSADVLTTAATSTITLGVIAGLVGGKLLGIYGGTLAAVRAGIGTLAPGLGRLQLAGGAALSGIGFTISLFIVDLAFTDENLADQARIGVLAASVIATLLGSALFMLSARHGPTPMAHATTLEPSVDAKHDHTRTSPDATLSLVEYADFECPFCGQATGMIQQVRDHFGSRLAYTYRHLPMMESHPHSELAARAAEVAAEHGKFWEMHNLLSSHQTALTRPDLLGYAELLGMDAESFTDQLDSAQISLRVNDDVASAAASGATATPTFFINGVRHVGPFDAASIIRALEEAGAVTEGKGQS